MLEQTDLPVGEIASALGYGAPGSFVRAFKRWHGVTPGAGRQPSPGNRPCRLACCDSGSRQAGYRTRARSAMEAPRWPESASGATRRLYAWAVFALTFGLMLSDYVSRQVITPIFPFLKQEWVADGHAARRAGQRRRADRRRARSIPIALLADRWGRVKSITAMAGLWGLATIGCGLSQSYGQMMAARAMVGLGEAGYGSAGGAILAHVFPKERHAMVMGAFLAAALFGSVGGVSPRRRRFDAFQLAGRVHRCGRGGLLLVVLYPIVVRDYKTVALVKQDAAARSRDLACRVAEIGPRTVRVAHGSLHLPRQRLPDVHHRRASTPGSRAT